MDKFWLLRCSQRCSIYPSKHWNGSYIPCGFYLFLPEGLSCTLLRTTLALSVMESPHELYYEHCVPIHRRISLISQNCTHYDYNPGLEICSYFVWLNSPDYICICDSQDGLCWRIPLCWAQGCECKIWSGDPGCTDVAAPMNCTPALTWPPGSSLSFWTDLPVTDLFPENRTLTHFCFFQKNDEDSLLSATESNTVVSVVPYLYLHRFKNHNMTLDCKTWIYHSLYDRLVWC